MVGVQAQLPVGYQHVVAEALGEPGAIEPLCCVEFEPLPRVVGEARRFVATHAPELPPDTYDALMLATSELVTNAVIHARTTLQVGVAATDTRVLVTVFDHDLGRREQRPYDREGGWGLGLVEALTERSAMNVHPEGGKTAWFTLPRGGSERP